jgi:hypothetical protein
MKKICTLRCQKGENKISKPKNGIMGQNLYGRVIYPPFWNFTWSKKNDTFGGQKGKLNLQNFGMIYPSFGNFTWRKKKYTFGG